MDKIAIGECFESLLSSPEEDLLCVLLDFSVVVINKVSLFLQGALPFQLRKFIKTIYVC